MAAVVLTAVVATAARRQSRDGGKMMTEEARRHGVHMILGSDNRRWQHGSIPL